MPKYTYKCTDKDCEFEWEAEHSIKDDPIKICKKCEKETAKRMISKTSFQLKGGGWYKDGY
jgi:putative FmdB family regulatory protein